MALARWKTSLFAIALRVGRLCRATGFKVKKVSGFDRISERDGRQLALASATLAMRDEALWPAKSQQRGQILEQRRPGWRMRWPLTQGDGRWHASENTCGADHPWLVLGGVGTGGDGWQAGPNPPTEPVVTPDEIGNYLEYDAVTYIKSHV